MQTKIGDIALNIPDFFVRIDSSPEDPAGSIPFAAQSDNAVMFALFSEISLNEAMPFKKADTLIKDIHKSLADNQGIIEANTGKTTAGNPCVYSIVKNRMEPAGVQYIFTMDIRFNKKAVRIQGFFEERGTTGQRETFVFSLARNDSQDPIADGTWSCDPYDPNYKKGFLMNASEEKEYDRIFPEHPLALARGFANYMASQN